MAAGIGSNITQWGRKLVNISRARLHSTIGRVMAWWKGGPDPIELGDNYRRAHFSLMWIGTVVWIIALASPDSAERTSNAVSIPGIDIAIRWSVASICLLFASLYFYLQYRHEIEIEIIKAGKTWKALDTQSIPAVTEVERRRVDELRDLTDQVSSSVTRLKDEIARFEHFDTQAMALNLQQRAKLQEIALLVSQARQSYQRDMPSLTDAQKAALLSDLLKNVHVGHEFLTISAAQSDLKSRELIEHWSHLTAALVDYRNTSDRIKIIGENFSKHMRDLRITSDSISGKSRRKFFLLDRVGPILFVFLGCAVMTARWLFGLEELDITALADRLM